MNGYTGDDRRGPSPDHDIIIRIDENVKNFTKRFNAHETWNDEQFSTLFTRTSGLQKFQWFLAGGLAILNILLVVGAVYFFK